MNERGGGELMNGKMLELHGLVGTYMYFAKPSFLK